MHESYVTRSPNTDWLVEVLEEVNLHDFHTKLTNDLQLTKLSHFDYVSENDLMQLGLSRPASRRLLAAVKKRKSFVNGLRSRIVGKLLPTSSPSNASTSRTIGTKLEIMVSNEQPDAELNRPNSEFGRLTCLINSQDIQIKEEIGNGVHGFVKKGEWATPNGRVVEVALKILKKDVMSEPGATFNDFVKEISVMHQLNHPNIIKLYGIVLSSPMMMVTELAPFGNLRDRLRKENGSSPISQLISFSVQIASGMAYLESKRFVHRDLAARNIFITHGKKILIGDLGLMRAIPTQDNHYVMSERTKIPYPWCAPESLKYKQFSSASDVYMFGVTLWEMFSFGKEPWAGMNLNEILGRISTQDKRLICPDACPTMVYQTMLQCWSTESKLRPNFPTLYQYLSTSYPLEVRCTQHISELGQKRIDGNLMFSVLSENQSDSHSKLQKLSLQDSNESDRKVLSCQIDDRILVVDGQPEKYWWKGQNQRTFEIGWFPLSSTRWLAPKRGNNYISKPLKNSFVHTGHCGQNGQWGNPRFIDRMYLKNALAPDDIDRFKASRFDTSLASCERQAERSQDCAGPNSHMKNKTKSKLSKLFGITDGTNHLNVINHAYHKFINEQPNLSSYQSNRLRTKAFRDSLVRSQSDELNRKQSPTSSSVSNTIYQLKDDEPPLIDFSDEPSKTSLTNQRDSLAFAPSPTTTDQQQSLLDIETPFPIVDPVYNTTAFSNQQRRSSDTRLNQIDEDYHLSWAGSWNTGTFYGSGTNIYSAYYCPQDASLPGQSNFEQIGSRSPNRYYSAVAEGENNSRSCWERP